MSKPSALGARKLIAFVATCNPGRAKVFYRDVLGLRLVDDGPYAMVFNAHGTMLRVQKVEALTPPGHTVLGWEVPDVAGDVKRLQKAGVKFQRYDGMGQDALGIWTSPAGGRIAWFKDPDGNTLSLTEF